MSRPFDERPPERHKEALKRKAETPLKKTGAFTRRAFISFLLLFFLLLSACTASKQEVKSYRSAEEMYGAALKEYFEVKYDLAEQTLKDLIERYPLTRYSLDGEILLADILYAGQKYDEARAYYTNFVVLHPGNPRASYALFQKGMCYFRTVLTIDRDQVSTRKALFTFRDLVREYPDSPYTQRAEELIGFLKRRLAEKEFYVGRFYFKNKNYKGALTRFREILKEFSDAGITDETLYYIGESYRRLGEEKLAREAFTTLIKDYPESPYIKDAIKRLDG
ncbi:MAG: outer membrane protein assembly factor BamD [Thermodesulfobacteriota bacterium]|nr:MAG: outer membrane protein assembly factor BamD [Thermodesulfobacteriota bacterium]